MWLTLLLTKFILYVESLQWNLYVRRSADCQAVLSYQWSSLDFICIGVSKPGQTYQTLAC